MDKYWKNVDSLFNSKDNRKVILLGYAVGLVLVAASIYKLYLRLSGHEDFSFGRISSLFLMFQMKFFLILLDEETYQCRYTQKSDTTGKT